MAGRRSRVLTEEQRERQREYDRQWKRRNPVARQLQHHRRRARVAGSRIAPITVAGLQGRFSLWGRYCSLCHREITGPVHSDHFKPLVRGGPHALSNLRPTCSGCNLTKGASWPWDRRCDCGYIYPRCQSNRRLPN